MTMLEKIRGQKINQQSELVKAICDMSKLEGMKNEHEALTRKYWKMDKKIQILFNA